MLSNHAQTLDMFHELNSCGCLEPPPAVCPSMEETTMQDDILFQHAVVVCLSRCPSEILSFRLAPSKNIAANAYATLYYPPLPPEISICCMLPFPPLSRHMPANEDAKTHIPRTTYQPPAGVMLAAIPPALHDYIPHQPPTWISACCKPSCSARTSCRTCSACVTRMSPDATCASRPCCMLCSRCSSACMHRGKDTWEAVHSNAK